MKLGSKKYYAYICKLPTKHSLDITINELLTLFSSKGYWVKLLKGDYILLRRFSILILIRYVAVGQYIKLFYRIRMSRFYKSLISLLTLISLFSIIGESFSPTPSMLIPLILIMLLLLIHKFQVLRFKKCLKI